jgi:hypothetical protein
MALASLDVLCKKVLLLVQEAGDGKKDAGALHAQLFSIRNVLDSAERVVISKSQPVCEEALNAVLRSKIEMGPPLCSLVARCFASAFNNGDSRNLYSTLSDLQSLPTARGTQLSTRVCAVTTLGVMGRDLGPRLSSDLGGTVEMCAKLIKASSQPALRQACVVSLGQVVEGAEDEGCAAHVEVAKALGRAMGDRVVEVRVCVPPCIEMLALHSNSFSHLPLEMLLQLCAKGLADESPAVVEASARALGLALAISVCAVRDAAAAASQAKIEAARGSSGGAGDDDDGGGKGHRKGSSFSALAAVSAFKRNKDKSAAPVLLDFAGCLAHLDSLWHKVSGTLGFVGVTLATVSALRQLQVCGELPPQRVSEAADFLLGRLDGAHWLGNDCDELLVRGAVSQVFRGVSQRLSERMQRELCELLLQRLPSAQLPQQLVALAELTHLFAALGDAAPAPDDAVAAIMPLLASPVHALRFEAALALGALAKTAPTLCGQLLEQSLRQLQTAQEALVGGGADTAAERRAKMFPLHGYAVAGSVLLLALPSNRLGVPAALPKLALSLAEELVNQQDDPKLASLSGVRLTCTRAGWAIASALAAQGASPGVPWLGVLMGLWGRAFTFQEPPPGQRADAEPTHELVRLEAALLALQALVRSSTAFITKRAALLQQIVDWLGASMETVQLGWISAPSKSRGQGTLLRIKAILMESFSCLPPSSYAQHLLHLLHMAADNLTVDPQPRGGGPSKPSPRSGSDEKQIWATTKTSLLPNLLDRADDNLETCSTAHANAETLLRMEPDSFAWRTLFMLRQASAMSEMEVEAATMSTAAWANSDVAREQPSSGAARLHMLPQHGCTTVRIVDAAVALFSAAFPALPQDHLESVIKLVAVKARDAELNRAKSTAPDKAECTATYNVVAALLGAIRALPAASEDAASTSWVLVLCNTPNSLLCALLSNPNPTLRRAAAQALGALARKMGSDFSAKIVSMLANRLKSKDGDRSGGMTAEGRAGTMFALTCLKRASGGRANINPALVYKHTTETVQPVRNWVLHSWCLVVESASVGTSFEQYIRSTGSLVDAHLLAPVNHNAAAWEPGLMACLVKLLNVLMSSLGPEVVGYPDVIRRVLTVWDFLSDSDDTHVQSECLHVVENLVMFAPAAVDCKHTLQFIRRILLGDGADVSERVRGQAITCLCRLAERHRSVLIEEKIDSLLFNTLNAELGTLCWRAAPLWHGLSCPRPILSCDNRVFLRDIKTALMEVVDMDGGVDGRPVYWVLFCRGIMMEGGTSKSHGDDDADEGGRFGLWTHAREQASQAAADLGALRWRVKLVALQCVRQVLHLIQRVPEHFDVAAARRTVETALEGEGASVATCRNFVSLHLEELLTMACSGVSVELDEQQLTGLQCVALSLLQDVVRLFVHSADADADAGEGVLEQYQAQINSALRHALSNTASPDLSAVACALASNGVADGLTRDPVVLKRTVRLILPPDLSADVLQPSSLSSFGAHVDGHVHVARLASLARLQLTSLPAAGAETSSWQTALKTSLASSSAALQQHWMCCLLDHMLGQRAKGLFSEGDDNAAGSATTSAAVAATATGGYFTRGGAEWKRVDDALAKAFPVIAQAVAATFASSASPAGEAGVQMEANFRFLLSALLWRLQQACREQSEQACVLCLESVGCMLGSPLFTVERFAPSACCELLRAVEEASSVLCAAPVSQAAARVLVQLTSGTGAAYLQQALPAERALLQALVQAGCRGLHQSVRSTEVVGEEGAGAGVDADAALPENAATMCRILALVPAPARDEFLPPLMLLLVGVVQAVAPSADAVTAVLAGVEHCVAAAAGCADGGLALIAATVRTTLDALGAAAAGPQAEMALGALFRLQESLLLTAPQHMVGSGTVLFARACEQWQRSLAAPARWVRRAALSALRSLAQRALASAPHAALGKAMFGALGAHVLAAVQVDLDEGGGDDAPEPPKLEGTKLLLLAFTQSEPSQQGALLSAVLLPTVLRLLEDGETSKQVAVQCTMAILSRAPMPFKEALGALPAEKRALLETSLRAAMVAQSQAKAATAGGSAPKKSLNLKRFTSS